MSLFSECEENSLISPKTADNTPTPRQPYHNNEKSALNRQIELLRAIQDGAVVSIFSGVLGEHVSWCLDAKVRRKALKLYPGQVTYTLDELENLAAMAPDGLREIHRIKKTFSARVV